MKENIICICEATIKQNLTHCDNGTAVIRELL